MIPEMSFFWIAVGCYGISAFSYIFGLIARKESLLNLGMALAAVGLLCHVTTVAIRWVVNGVAPFLEISEALTTGMLIAVLIFLLIQFSAPRLKAMGVLVMPVCFALMGWAGTLIKDIGGTLPATVQSKWLWVHVVGATTGFSGVLTAGALGLLFLLKERSSGGVYDRIPDLKTLDDYGCRFIAGGFVMLGLMLVSGSLWYHQIKGSYWSWDPVEIWSLCSWLVYGVYFFLRIVMGWRNRRMAWFALLALGVMIISYWGIPFFKGDFHAGLSIEQY
jgi:ABC-type transport system involved in cytochrome c biogenesis permease subunit